MVGYVASLLLLVSALADLWAIYTLRTAAGLCVAAVVPVVSALLVEQALQARRFAWLGAAALVGFLFGPALNALADVLAG